MNARLHRLLNHCPSTCRFILGWSLLVAGEIAATLWHQQNMETPGVSGPFVLYGLIILGWNLAILILFFHLPFARELRKRHWIQSGLYDMQHTMRGVTDIQVLAKITLKRLVDHLHADNGVLYLSEENQHLRLTAGYGISPNRAISLVLESGEGLLGQAAEQRKIMQLTNIPMECLRMPVEIVEIVPNHALILPLIHEDQLKGVLALGAMRPFARHHVAFLEQVAETIARAFSGVQAGAATRKLLDQTRLQADELAINQNVLRGTIEQLEQESGFKSRFLANMSHELRSPLNSLLILARLLKENKSGNLTSKQVEFAATIHSAGSDLLTLIDEILDLARIEAGRIRIFKDQVKLNDLALSLERLFAHVAREKKLDFQMTCEKNLPLSIYTDKNRLEQILKNLITNAIKFTSAGKVAITFKLIRPAPQKDNATPSPEMIAMAVSDTGIGIPADQQAIIFEPFRQLDDGANRKFGGTGLGLAISKELSQLLNGRIELSSEEGKGSHFTLYLPIEQSDSITSATKTDSATNQPLDIDGIRDDRRDLRPNDRSILLVGIDYNRIRAISELARSLGLGVVVAGDQGAALFLANFFQPVASVVIGGLPGITPTPLIENIKTAVYHQPLPVLYLIPPGMPVLNKPYPDDTQMIHLSTNSTTLPMETTQFLQTMAQKPITSLKEPDDTEKQLPFILPERKPSATDQEFSLQNKHILLVDDDMRNVFAMTSLLEEKGGQVIMAENGQSALKILQTNPFIDIVLLDIMMPDRNGYEVLGEIRQHPEWKNLPILVLTAKALQGERQRCLDAGASDYLSKPIDSHKLLSMMQIWLQKKRIPA